MCTKIKWYVKVTIGDWLASGRLSGSAAEMRFVTSAVQGIPLWAMNGIGLSFLVPTSQSLIADYNKPSQRGKAFGLLQFTGMMGAFLGALYATNLGKTLLACHVFTALLTTNLEKDDSSCASLQLTMHVVPPTFADCRRALSSMLNAETAAGQLPCRRYTTAGNGGLAVCLLDCGHCQLAGWNTCMVAGRRSTLYK
jgi:hypothetical protein